MEYISMRLKNLRIKNFRGIGNNNGEPISITLFDQNIVFLIGKNNAGKSSILHAYDYLFNDKDALKDDFFDKDCRNSIEIEVELELNKSEIPDSPLFSEFSEEFPEKLILIFKRVWKSTGESEIHLGTNGNPPEFIDRRSAKNKKALESLKEKFPEPVWIGGMSSTKDVVSQLQKLIKGAILDQIQENHKEDCEEIGQLIQQLQSKMLKSGSWTSDLQNRLNQNIQQVFPNLNLEIINEGNNFNFSDLFSQQTQVQISDKSNNVKLDLDSQGHGVQRQAILSAYKECHQQFATIKSKSKDKSYNFEDNDQSHIKRKILLLEEPELFLHPSGVRSLQRLLYELADKSPFQLICATHSPIMIDLARPHSSLVRVEKANNVVLLHQLNTDIDLTKDGKELLTMIRSFNPYVCESFFSDCVILVEGPTESVVLNVLLDKFRSQINGTAYLVNMESISVVECGGKGTIPLFQKILRSFKIPYFVFHDLDYAKTKDGKSTNVWKINESIWNEIEAARSNGTKSSRYVFDRNFEEEHHYSMLDKSAGKPYVAWQESQKWSNEWKAIEDISKLADKYPIVKALEKILLDKWDDLDIHDQTWVASKEKEAPTDFIDESQLSLF
jgi:putative ATP-dependent endonuclease of OLD family